MIRSKRILVVLALCALGVGVVVFSAGGVHAEVGAKWTLTNNEGKVVEVTKELLPEVGITGVETGDMSMVFKTGGGTNVKFLCQKAEFLNAKLELNGVVGGGNKTRFKECETYLNSVKSPACKPSSSEGSGILISESLKGSLMLSGGKAVILFEPVSGTKFLTIQFSEECSIGGSCVVSGKNSIADAKGELGVQKPTHSVQQGPINELSAAGQPAEVLGIGVLELSGAHAGMKWAGTPA